MCEPLICKKNLPMWSLPGYLQLIQNFSVSEKEKSSMSEQKKDLSPAGPPCEPAKGAPLFK